MNIQQQPAHSDATNQSTDATPGVARRIGLFIAAPFVAVAYSVALPFVGMYFFSKEGFGMFQHTPTAVPHGAADEPEAPSGK